MAMRRRSVQDPRGHGLRSRRVLRPRPHPHPDPRRVLSVFLKLRCEARKPAEVFDAGRMERMLRSGKPDDAHYYMERFLPFSFDDWSEPSRDLLAHVGVFKTLAKVAAGGEEGARVASLFANPSEYMLRSDTSVRLHKTIAILHADRTRAPMIWQKLEAEGLDRIMDLVARCPELQGEVRMPRKRPLLWDAAPNGLRQCPSRCRQTASRAPADVLIRTFLKKRLLSVRGRKRNHSVTAACSRNASCQSAMLHMKMERDAPQSAVLEGVSHTPILHRIPPTMACPAKTSDVFSSATNADNKALHC